MQHGFHLTVTGKVQGVGYRRWFAQLAQAKGLRGYVKKLKHRRGRSSDYWFKSHVTRGAGAKPHWAISSQSHHLKLS